ncbi:hypothetical protein [Bradyrhizobium ivorense]|uniref:hypothetical protein n=1 Tax=Bradyrhizobium ivorense TaxID=2511166 RepID=UPI001FCE469D|nr:hypothetical protein [Bradyrhizobium ivorense]
MSVSKFPAHHRRSEREQLDLFRALPGGLAPRRIASPADLQTRHIRFTKPEAQGSQFELQGAAA